MNKRRLVAAMIGGLALTAVVVSCVRHDDTDAPEDAENADLGGKTDTVGLDEGTVEAYGVLAVANSLSFAQLRYEAELSQRAAENIVAYRLGDDEEAGTSDDEHFGSLAELDTLPFVGPVAFGKLLSYARSHGYIPGTLPDGGSSGDGGWSQDGGWSWPDAGSWPPDGGGF